MLHNVMLITFAEGLANCVILSACGADTTFILKTCWFWQCVQQAGVCYLLPASLKLGLDQHNEHSSRPQKLTDDWHHLQNRDERQV